MGKVRYAIQCFYIFDAAKIYGTGAHTPYNTSDVIHIWEFIIRSPHKLAFAAEHLTCYANQIASSKNNVCKPTTRTLTYNSIKWTYI